MNKAIDKEVNNYLNKLLTQQTPYILTEDEQRKREGDLATFIVDKLSRKEFRRRKLSDNTRQKIENKVKLSLKENKPVHFTIPFGGYKHFWNFSHPEPDWAELFNFRYLTQYVSPVLSVYKPGVVLEYISEDLILNRMNNYPQKSLDQYSKVFKRLIEWYRKYIPKNLSLNYFRVGDRCDKSKIIERIESLLSERRAAFNKLSDEAKEKELHRSYRSVFWNGARDLNSLNEKQRMDKIIESRLIELAYYETEAQPEFLGDYLWVDNHICICFSFGLSADNATEDLTLGSTYGSIVDYWIGRGILEDHNGSYIPRIVSHQQYELIKDKLKAIPQNILPLKNFQQIEIYPGYLNFN